MYVARLDDILAVLFLDVATKWLAIVMPEHVNLPSSWQSFLYQITEELPVRNKPLARRTLPRVYVPRPDRSGRRSAKQEVIQKRASRKFRDKAAEMCPTSRLLDRVATYVKTTK